MAGRSSPSADRPRWRHLLNLAFGADRWRLLGEYEHTNPHARKDMPKLYVIGISGVTSLLCIQEWPDHGYTYFFETDTFNVADCVQELKDWATPLTGDTSL